MCLGLILTGCAVFSPNSEPTPAPNPVIDPGVLAEANLVPAEEIVLVFAIPGRVGEILIDEGDAVQLGEELARLDDVESLEAQVASAEFSILQAEQSLDDLNEQASLVATRAQVDLIQAHQELVNAEKAWDAVDTDDFQEELDDARIDMADAEDDLENAEEELADYEDLDADNPTREAAEEDLEQAQQDYDEAVWAYQDLQNRYDLAQSQLDLAQEALEDAEREAEETADGPHPDELALAEANLSQAEAQLAAAEAALEDATLVAPLTGQILRLELTQGQQVSPGSMAMVLADTSEWYLETNDLTEDEVVRINPEEPISVRFDAIPDETFSGEIESISDYFIEQFGDITYVVRIRLLDSDERLRWGMTAEISFSE
jgi:multidrug resistance efflux pump